MLFILSLLYFIFKTVIIIIIATTTKYEVLYLFD